jgi:Domain of unknown function (DUF1707)
MSPPDPNLRASDEERDHTASQLREHHAVGRLSSDEFSERLDAAFKAKTVGELDHLLRDLPKIDLYRLSDAPLTRQPKQAQPARRGGSGEWRAAWTSWFTVSLLCVFIWAATGHGYPWWLWVAGPWGVVMAGSQLATVVGRSGNRQVGRGSGPGQLPPGQDGS